MAKSCGMNIVVRKLSLPIFLGLLAVLVGVTLFSMGDAGPEKPAAEKTATATAPLPVPELPPIYIEQIAKVNDGQTLAQVLDKADFSPSDIHYATRALNKEYRVSRMPAGAEFIYAFKEPGPGQTPVLDSLALYTKDDKFIKVNRQENGRFETDVDKRHVIRMPQVATGTIKSSLYLAAQNAGLPDRLIVPFIELFSWDLDFTRDVRRGDTFRVVYEEILDERGEFIRYGKILAGEMALKRKDEPVSAFLAPNGDYYDKDGRAKKRALLRTPLKFTRISSHYNLQRKHPVLGYTRAHRGTDFAAPTGTPVQAAGDGRVVSVKWNGGYGRYVKIKHNNRYSTAYAHLHRYARGLRPGKYVRQGQTIAYVGSSGMSTGPHLHYEVHVNGRQVNPMRVKLPKGEPLPAKHKDGLQQQVALAEKLWLQAGQLANISDTQTE